MELGFTGIAYNRTVRGILSDRDRCSIVLLSLSSLLNHAPSLSSSVRLHRDILGVRHSSPFRQYTRLTVCVENTSQAQALNTSNPVLKTYDLVAARPLNQIAFDHLCEKSEVDIIAIDFSEKLPFRLKFPMVKAAIERGIYFEITYSSLNTDVQSRRQMIPNAKLLVDWSRGKNLILSSAAASANELRGPYDIANLSSLLGLSMERAKISISKNCRSLITNAIRKRKFYKEAIRIELIPSIEHVDSIEAISDNYAKWDPISSGEGDVLLDDLEKSFSVSAKVPERTKAIDFASLIDNLPSHGFRVTDVICGPKVVSESPDNKIASSAVKSGEVSDLTVESFELPDVTELQASNSGSPPETSPMDDDSREDFSVRLRHCTTHTREEHKVSTELDTHCTMNTESVHIPILQNQVLIEGANVACTAKTGEDHQEPIEFGMHCTLNEESVDVPLFPNEVYVAQQNVVLPDDTRDGVLRACESNTTPDLMAKSKEIDFLSAHANVGLQSNKTDKLSHDIDMRTQFDVSSISYDKSLQEKHLNNSVVRVHREDAESPSEVHHVESHDESISGKCEPSKEEIMEKRWIENMEIDANAAHSVPGKCRARLRRRVARKPLLYAFKRLVNPIPFKKKTKRSRPVGRLS